MAQKTEGSVYQVPPSTWSLRMYGPGLAMQMSVPEAASVMAAACFAVCDRRARMRASAKAASDVTMRNGMNQRCVVEPRQSMGEGWIKRVATVAGDVLGVDEEKVDRGPAKQRQIEADETIANIARE